MPSLRLVARVVESDQAFDLSTGEVRESTDGGEPAKDLGFLSVWV